DRYRCIVPDHMGCGLSDKPPDSQYSYRLSQRVDDIQALLSSLEFSGAVNLVVHDWGGMIGFAWATRHKVNVDRMVIMNTAAFPMPESKKFPFALWLAGKTSLGALLVRGLNAFSGLAARVAFKKPVSREIRAAYTGPYDSWRNRIATLRFVQDIPLSPGDEGYDLVGETAAGLDRYLDRPALLAWGMKDFVFDRPFLEKWKQYLPAARAIEYPDCGHYILEDAATDLVPRIAEFLDQPAHELERA
ncbi:MAG: alpha/beta hydrolase, partial [Xanthomonadales bacterium]|nr:alpha/beta hydrolase [Xanthomonadales bacterium]